MGVLNSCGPCDLATPSNGRIGPRAAELRRETRNAGPLQVRWGRVRNVGSRCGLASGPRSSSQFYSGRSASSKAPCSGPITTPAPTIRGIKGLSLSLSLSREKERRERVREPPKLHGSGKNGTNPSCSKNVTRAGHYGGPCCDALKRPAKKQSGAVSGVRLTLRKAWPPRPEIIYGPFLF